MSIKKATTSNIQSKELNGYSGWTRPSDWIPMVDQTADENKIQILNAVFDDESQFAAVQVSVNTGTYTVDWGDGTVETVTSGTAKQHQYTYSTLGNLCSRGYKQALITITPTTTGAYFTVVSSITPSNTGVTTQVNFLDMFVSATYSSLSYTMQPYCRLLERFWMFSGIARAATAGISFNNCNSLRVISPLDITGANNVSQMFGGCYELEYLPEIKGLDGITVATSYNFMFNNCYKLREVYKFPIASGANCANMFSSCTSLTKIPNFNFGLPISTASMFSNCNSLKQIDASFDITNCTTTANMFTGCSSLLKIPTITGSGAVLTTVASMYSNCYQITEAPDLNTQNVTNFSSLHNNNVALINGPAYNTTAATTVSSMFTGCVSLVSIPSYVLTSVTGTGMLSFLSGCTSLSTIPTMTVGTGITGFTSTFPTTGRLAKLQMSGLKFSFSIITNMMSATELNNLYTLLPTVTGQTLNVTGNWGTASDTPSIATAKGWTITG